MYISTVDGLFISNRSLYCWLYFCKYSALNTVKILKELDFRGGLIFGTEDCFAEIAEKGCIKNINLLTAPLSGKGFDMYNDFTTRVPRNET